MIKMAFLFIPNLLGALVFQADSSLEKATIENLEPIELHLHLTYPKTYHINIEEIKENLLQQNFPMPTPPYFTLLEKKEKETLLNDKIYKKLTFYLKPLKEGSYPISFFVVAFYPSSEDEEKVLLVPNAVRVNVEKSRFQKDKPLIENLMTFSSDFYPVFDLKPNLDEYQKKINEKAIPYSLLIALPLIIFILLITKYAAVFFLQTRTKKNGEKFTEEALRLLNHLENSRLPHPELAPESYSRLCFILKKYIEGFLKIPVLSKTTPELLKLIKESSFVENEWKEKINSILTKDDLYKFGKISPNHQELKEDFLIVKQLFESEQNKTADPQNL